jgi:hypothetical protein
LRRLRYCLCKRKEIEEQERGCKHKRSNKYAAPFAYNHKTISGNQPQIDRFQPKPYLIDTLTVQKVGKG